MAEHCMVIAGEWQINKDSNWNFSIDKDHMTRIVSLRSGITLTELLTTVFKEFFDNNEVLRTASLSYWPPNSKELATGLTTPPVMLTNDGAVSYFYQHFQTNKGMNLFVTFNSQLRASQTSHVDENPLPFTTPNQPIKRTHSPFSSSAFSQDCLTGQISNRTHVPPLGSPPVQHVSYPPIQPASCPPATRPSSASQIPDGSIPGEDTLNRPFPNARRSCPAKPSRLSLIDETILCGDEMLEDMFKEDPGNIPDSWVTDDDEETGSDAEVPPDIDDVQSRGCARAYGGHISTQDRTSHHPLHNR
ncbi:SWIM-type domain-containing protein [Raphanus sativus]|nr:SWIM-type domain-containing protein [Raphanus sativus]